jgi:UDP-glucuronate decarboxylase
MGLRNHSGKRVLVTGGAGFIGSHLCDRLLGAGDEVFCVDDFSTGHAANIEHLNSEAMFHTIRQDITAPFEADVDEIYNLACPASPPRYQHTPIQTIRTSVLGALNMLELADRIGAKILQASTSEVYGDPLEHPQRETYWGNVNPIGRRSCYDEGKRCAETLFFDYHREVGLDIKVARIFNAYGPRMDRNDGRVVSNFIVQALEGRPISLFGDGLQTRCFAYVDDTVDGLVKMMDRPSGTTGPINLGNPVEITIAGLARMILEMTGSESEIVHAPLPQDDPVRRCPDITLARTELDWNPATSLAVGLGKTIAFFDGPA